MIEVCSAFLRYRSPVTRLWWPKRRSTAADNWALEDVSFQLQRGQVVGVVGANGAGKSTLLRLLAGVYRADKGTVRVHGSVVPLLSLSGGFEMELSGVENIRLCSLLWGAPEYAAPRVQQEIIEFSGLGDAVAQPLRTYSTGMLSRLGFSIATAITADVLLLDEVLAVGDGRFQRRCNGRISSLVENSSTVLVCSHQLGWLRAHCDQVMWLDLGRVVKLGDTNEVLDAYEGFLAGN